MQSDPTFNPDEKNGMKSISTRSGLEISFNDKDVILQIRTPGGQSFTLDDGAGSITLKDKNNNVITLSAAGISLESASDVSISAKGNITLAASGDLHMNATGNASLSATQIKQSASATFSAQGSASAELKASGQVTVQGAMVLIN
jgi:hypothetical protein